jgi:spermidine/putrescine-binding protein
LHSRLARRDVLRRAAALGLAVPAANWPAARIAAAPARAQASGRIRVLGIQVALQEPFLLQFTEETGIEIEPVLDTFPGMTNKLSGSEASNYDAAIQTSSYLPPMWDAGNLDPIPVDKIPNWEFARPLFTDPEAPGTWEGLPGADIYTDSSQTQFKCVPSFFNLEAFGFNSDQLPADTKSYGALFDPAYASRSAIWNDPIWTSSYTALYLIEQGLMDPPERSVVDLTPSEIDTVVAYLVEQKQAGQFRAIWSDYGEIVNLMATEEVWVSDAWNPAIEDAKNQGNVPLVYVNPTEGNRAWFEGLVVSKFSENKEAVYAFADWMLAGWYGAQIASLGYYSCATTVEEVMSEEDYDFWYTGGGRDSGSYDERVANISCWPKWPTESAYYTEKWLDLINA